MPEQTTTICQCSGCEWHGPIHALGRQLHEMHHPSQYCHPGEETPAGECPICQSLAYVAEKEPPEATGPTRRIALVWTASDIRTQIAAMLEIDELDELPADADAELPAFCGEVLDALLHRHDPERGVTWDVIATTIAMRGSWPALHDRLRAKFAPQPEPDE